MNIKEKLNQLISIEKNNCSKNIGRESIWNFYQGRLGALLDIEYLINSKQVK